VIKTKTDTQKMNVCFCENAPSKSLLKRKLFCSFA